MIKKNLIEYGNSQHVLIDKFLLKALGLSKKGEVMVSLEKDKIVIRAVKPARPQDDQ